MKNTIKLISWLIVLVSALSCAAQSKIINNEDLKSCEFLNQSDAEKIIGQPVRLIESISKIEGDVRKSGCTYRGLSKDKVSGKDINLYFSLERQERNPTVERARQQFESTYKKIDEPLLLVQLLSGIGDEAFVISNPPNFHFMMVRKGATIFRMKLNKAPAETSFEELRAFGKKIAEQL